MEEAGLGPAPEDSSWSVEDQPKMEEVQSTAITPGIRISIFKHHVAVETSYWEAVAVGQSLQPILFVAII